MNAPTAFAEPTMRGYIGRFRLSWRTEAFAVREGRDGPIRYFPTAAEAECEAWRVKAKIEEPHYRREGATAKAVKFARAEKLLFLGKGKAIPIERRKTA